MKKSIIFLICFAFLVRGLQLYGLYSLYNLSYIEERNKNFNEISGVKNIKVNVSNVDVEIKKSSDDKIHLEHNASYSVERDYLYLEEHIEKKGFFLKSKQESVKIFVPENVSILLETVNSNVSFDEVVLKNIFAEVLTKIKIFINNVKVVEDINFNIQEEMYVKNSKLNNTRIEGSGKINFKNVEGEKLYIYSKDDLVMESVNIKNIETFTSGKSAYMKDVVAKVFKAGAKSEIGSIASLDIENLVADDITLSEKGKLNVTILGNKDDYEIEYHDTTKSGYIENKQITKRKNNSNKKLTLWARKNENVVFK